MLKAFHQSPLPFSGTLPKGRQIFAIGDIHGRDIALAAALDVIRTTPRTGSSVLVFLGDLVSRGPGSLTCLSMASRAQELADVDGVVILPGNHEIMMAQSALGHHAAMTTWSANGGAEMVEEIDRRTGSSLRFQNLNDTMAGLRAAVAEVIGPDWPHKILSADSHHIEGDVLFVHAGLDPSQDPARFLALPAQVDTETHWAWIRTGFLDHQSGWGCFSNVVHGHSVPLFARPRRLELTDYARSTSEVLERHARLCLDARSAALERVGFAALSADGVYIGLADLEQPQPWLEPDL